MTDIYCLCYWQVLCVNGKKCKAHPLNPSKFVPIVFVGAVVPHRKLCVIPTTWRSHHRGQSPSDSSTILPCEGAFVVVPCYFNRVPVTLLLGGVEHVVNLVEARDASDEGFFVEPRGPSWVGLRGEWRRGWRWGVTHSRIRSSPCSSWRVGCRTWTEIGKNVIFIS